MSRIAVVVLMLVIICNLGCAHKMSQFQKQSLNSWMGAHISEYIQAHGSYNQITSDEQGGSIYIWVRHYNMPILPPSPAPVTGGFTAGFMYGLSDVLRARNQQRNATPLVIQMCARQNGLIYSWQVSGLDNSVELPVRPRW